MNVMTHGFDLDASLHEQLRGAPATESLRWVEAQLGTCVVDVRALEGGNSSAVHLLTLASFEQVVLRRYVRDWVVSEPWIPGNEALVLSLLNDAPSVPAPRLLAADPDGTATGTPTVVMSALPGRMLWEPVDLDQWLRGLAGVLPAIHAVPVASGMLDWAPYPPDFGPEPPRWTRHPRAWERALQAYAGPRPPASTVFLHRDFHPGNVLWDEGRISGIVDWTSSCAGPPGEDVAHCRLNLAVHHGQGEAERFLAYWLDITGRTDYDPYWDLVDAVSMVSDDPDERLDEFVAAAASRFGVR
jgi:aminoglycoside phosphotransferase (APT) family kinase protein